MQTLLLTQSFQFRQDACRCQQLDLVTKVFGDLLLEVDLVAESLLAKGAIQNDMIRRTKAEMVLVKRQDTLCLLLPLDLHDVI